MIAKLLVCDHQTGEILSEVPVLRFIGRDWPRVVRGFSTAMKNSTIQGTIDLSMFL